MKKCQKENCNSVVFSKGFCKFHQPKKTVKKLDFNTQDLESLTTSDLKKIADYELRQYLLRREGNHNYIFCPLKNKNYPREVMQVAHFIDRGIMNTRYDLCNCHLVSKQSNQWDSQIPKQGYKSLHHYEYELYLGEQIVKDLRERSKEKKVFYKEDYIEIINKFRNECKR